MYARDLAVGIVIVVAGALVVGAVAGISPGAAIALGGMVVLSTAAFPLMQGAGMSLTPGDRWWVFTETAGLAGEQKETAITQRRWWMSRAFGVGLVTVVVGIAVEILA